MFKKHPHDVKPVTREELRQVCLRIITDQKAIPLENVDATIGVADLLSVDDNGILCEYALIPDRDTLIFDTKKKDKGARPAKMATYAGVLPANPSVLLPKHFYCVFPLGVISRDSLPSFCGAIEVLRLSDGSLKYKASKRPVHIIKGHRPATQKELLRILRQVTSQDR